MEPVYREFLIKSEADLDQMDINLSFYQRGNMDFDLKDKIMSMIETGLVVDRAHLTTVYEAARFFGLKSEYPNPFPLKIIVRRIKIDGQDRGYEIQTVRPLGEIGRSVVKA